MIVPEKRRLYGRRKGRSMGPYKNTLMTTLLPTLRLPLAGASSTDLACNVVTSDRSGAESRPVGKSEAEGLNSQPFISQSLETQPKLLQRQISDQIDRAALGVAPDQPLVLEIGFGAGEHLAGLAQRHPKGLFIGAEIFENGIAALLSTIQRLDISNIRIHDNDARALMDHLAPGIFDHIYLLFPDPWPKSRHVTRRFLCRDTLTVIQNLLKTGGFFTMASDHPEMIDWMIDQMSQHGDGFSGVPVETPPADWVSTRYETKAIREGRACFYMPYQKK